jgi:hypothetical protein
MGYIFFVGLFHSLFQPGLSRHTLTPGMSPLFRTAEHPQRRRTLLKY